MNELWFGIGLAGQTCLATRFLIQWIASERRGYSVIPRAFWTLSLAGGATMLAYAIYRRDPVFIAGQSAGLIVYARNMTLIRRRAREKENIPCPAHTI